MKVDNKISEDLHIIKNTLQEYIDELGLFGSVLHNPITSINDIDVLILYKGISFDELKRKIQQLELNYPTYEAYLNVSYISSGKTRNAPLGYHIILMPAIHPCQSFLERHKGNIQYYN